MDALAEPAGTLVPRGRTGHDNFSPMASIGRHAEAARRREPDGFCHHRWTNNRYVNDETLGAVCAVHARIGVRVKINTMPFTTLSAAMVSRTSRLPPPRFGSPVRRRLGYARAACDTQSLDRSIHSGCAIQSMLIIPFDRSIPFHSIFHSIPFPFPPRTFRDKNGDIMGCMCGMGRICWKSDRVRICASLNLQRSAICISLFPDRPGRDPWAGIAPFRTGRRVRCEGRGSDAVRRDDQSGRCRPISGNVGKACCRSSSGFSVATGGSLLKLVRRIDNVEQGGSPVSRRVSARRLFDAETVAAKFESLLKSTRGERS